MKYSHYTVIAGSTSMWIDADRHEFDGKKLSFYMGDEQVASIHSLDFSLVNAYDDDGGRTEVYNCYTQEKVSA